MDRDFDMIELSCVMKRHLRFHPMSGSGIVLLLLVQLSTILKSNLTCQYKACTLLIISIPIFIL